MAFIVYINWTIFFSVQNEVELLQTGTAIANRGRFITNRGSYYKSGQLLKISAQHTSIVVGSFLLKLKTITMN